MKSEPIIMTDTLTEMIPVMRAACSLPPLNAVELKHAREAWSLVLLNHMPAQRVKEMITHMLRSLPEGRRVFGAPEVLNYYRNIHHEELDRDRVLEEKPCKSCNGKLVIKIYSPSQQCDIEVPCPFHVHVQKILTM